MRQLGVTISPILRGKNEVSGAICLLTDLTELVALQKQVQVKENLAALGELSAGIAHEFKNALATISGYAQMIRSESEGGEIHDHAQNIVEQTRALTHVVTEFLKFARPLEISYEPLSVEPMLSRVLAEVGETQPNVEISRSRESSRRPRRRRPPPPGHPQSGAQRRRIRRHAPVRRTRHRPRLCGTGRSPRPANLHFRQRPRHLRPTIFPKIFLPFYTTKANGTGLGLAVVQKIIVQHGGTIEARNLTEGGAEFIVWLPQTREAIRGVASVEARA